MGGRAIAYVFAISQVMCWVQEAGGDDAGRGQAAIEFLKADIDGVAREFDLLETGILDSGEASAGLPADRVLSRSIPVPA